MLVALSDPRRSRVPAGLGGAGMLLVADRAFEHPRLASIYDAIEADRSDLDAYLGIVEELGARRVLDVGCGTGTFALLLADLSIEVTGVDPAGASLAVARAKPGAGRVRWVHGHATDVPPLQADLVTMTGNVAQAIADPQDWDAALIGARAALRPGGRLVFETRDPTDRAWTEWTAAATRTTTTFPGVGAVEHWMEVTDVTWPLVTFRATWIFAAGGQVLSSDSTLRFRDREDVETALSAHGFELDDLRDAPDRPGRELVFIARRP